MEIMMVLQRQKGLSAKDSLIIAKHLVKVVEGIMEYTKDGTPLRDLEVVHG